MLSAVAMQLSEPALCHTEVWLEPDLSQQRVDKVSGIAMHTLRRQFSGMRFTSQYDSSSCLANARPSAEQADVMQAYNMAAIWQLPCVFVIENNHFGMGTADTRAAKSATYYTRGDYIPGVPLSTALCRPDWRSCRGHMHNIISANLVSCIGQLCNAAS